MRTASVGRSVPMLEISSRHSTVLFFSLEADMPTPRLNGKHETTLRTIFQHPVSHNLDWHQVVRLLSSLGTIDEHPDGRVTARINDQEAVLHRPRHKDINSIDEVMLIRHFLERAGISPPA
jgi:hypothetical protein